jgi:DNA-binding transcriptional ArsR family regulator
LTRATVACNITLGLNNQAVRYAMEAEQLNRTFAALSDPTRRAILARLADGPATVKELSAPFAISGPAVSKHLRMLERAGLIARGREAQWRPCRLEPEPLKAVADWAEPYRRFWDASYRRLDDYLQQLQAQEGQAHPTRAPGKERNETRTKEKTHGPHGKDRVRDRLQHPLRPRARRGAHR